MIAKCPSCGADVDSETARQFVAVCPTCRRSVVFVGASLRLATAEDTVMLSNDDLAALRKQRAAKR